jgi:hypothetical protein
VAFFAAPLAWLIDLEASYAIVPWACAHARRGVLFLIPAACLAVIAIGGSVCWSAWIALRRQSTLDGGAVADRSSFIALLGLLMHATFALLIVTTFAARYLLSPCE